MTEETLAGASEQGEAGELVLSEAERELVTAEAGFYGERAASPASQAAFQRLQEAAASGRVGEDLLPVLGSLLELSFVAGRLRAVHGVPGEVTATALFRRTPQGEALQRRCEQVNEALAALRGRELAAVSLSPRGAGLYTLVLETRGCRVVLSLTPSGPDIRSLEVEV